MAKQTNRPSLRERVEMRKRGIDPDKLNKPTKGRAWMRLTGITLQVVTVFALLGYIVYFVQQERVQLSIEFLVIASGLFVFARLLTFLGSGSGGNFRF